MGKLNNTSTLTALVLVQVRGFDIDYQGDYQGDYSGEYEGDYEGDFLEDFGGSYTAAVPKDPVEATDCICWFSVKQVTGGVNFYLGTTFEMGTDCTSPFDNGTSSPINGEFGNYGTIDKSAAELDVIYETCHSGYWIDCLSIDTGPSGLLVNNTIGEITAAAGKSCSGADIVYNSRSYHENSASWCFGNASVCDNDDAILALKL